MKQFIHKYGQSMIRAPLIFMFLAVFAFAPFFAAQAKSPERSVLFIGNSYTFYHDMPDTLVRLAGSDAGNKVQFQIKSVTRGGMNLTQLWNLREARQALPTHKWDYVVLQEQSFWPFLDGNIQETTAASVSWAREIIAVGAKPVVFMSWPRQPGSAWYSDPQSPFLKNPDYSHGRFQQQSKILAKKIGGSVVPVGDYWYFAMQEYPQLQLYEADGSHPSAEGSFLTALVFYYYFTGRSPTETTYTPPGISEDHAKILRLVASYKG